MKRGENWFLKNYEQIYLDNIRSVSFAIRTSKGRAPAFEVQTLKNLKYIFGSQ